MKDIITYLNPKIKGWSNYFRSGTSKQTFNTLDRWMWNKQSSFVSKRHPKKSRRWRNDKYWGKIRGRNDQWVFMDKNSNAELFLWKLAWTPIKRHILVKGRSSPDDPNLKEYWQKRQANNSKNLYKLKSVLWRKQEGKCPICYDNIDNGESVKVCRILPEKDGDDNSVNNSSMLHRNCHKQLHNQHGQQITNVSKLLEPYAG